MTPPTCEDPGCWATVHRILSVPHYHEPIPPARADDAYPVVGAEETDQPPLFPVDP